MGIFKGKYSKYYTIPERVASDYPSRMLRTVEKELERNLELQQRYGRLSPVSNEKHLKLLQETHMRLSRRLDDVDPVGKYAHKVKSGLVGRGLLGTAISGLLKRERATRTQTAKPAAKASAADSRAYAPAPKEVRNARTVFGTDAHFSVNSLGRHYFKTRYLVIPCIQRQVRKEVLFAIGKGGKGYRGRHKGSPYGHIWC